MLKEEKHREGGDGVYKKIPPFPLDWVLRHKTAKIPFQTNQAISWVQFPTTGPRHGSHWWKQVIKSPSEQSFLSVPGFLLLT